MHKPFHFFIDSPTILSECNSYSLDRQVNCVPKLHIYQNAIVCPYLGIGAEEISGDVILSDGRIAHGTNSHTEYANEERVVTLPMIECEENEIIYLGSLPVCWGHYITDGLSKLWFFYTDKGKELLQRGVRVGITTCYVNMDSVPSAYQHLFDVLGLPIKVEIIKDMTHYKTVYCPDNSLFVRGGTRYYLKEQNEIIDRLIESVQTEGKCFCSFEKIYFSRSQLQTKNAEFGERDLEKVFAKAGYKIIYPEQHSFEEQVYMLQHVKSLVATEGSIAHNAVFCRPETEVIILRKAFYTNDHQYVINQMRNLNVTYIDVHLSLFTNDQPNLGPFFLYVNDNLVRFFKNRYGMEIENTFSERRFLKYVQLCTHRADFYERVRSEVPQYYYDQLQVELSRSISGLKLFYRKVLTLLPQGIANKLRILASRFTR